jgi:SDR family mycofactocin-dependent oxidoreductase
MASGRVEQKVAFITGAARGQGRAHAVRLAEEGADIVAVDLPPGSEVNTVTYAMAAADDLARTAELVEGLGRRIITAHADVRDQQALDKAAQMGLDEFGHIDVVIANASILASGDLTWETPEARWVDSLDINLTGTWRTITAAVPSMIEAGRGGSVIITSSTAGLRSAPRTAAYTSSKHAVVGLMRTLAIELAPYSIRVNTIHPTTVATDMILSPSRFKRFRPDLEDPKLEDVIQVLQPLNLLPIPWLEPIDVSNAVLWLASDEARYVTGVALPVDAGATIK